MARKTRTHLTAEQKMDIVKQSKGGTSRAQLASKFNCSDGTIGNVLAAPKGKARTGGTGKHLIPLASIHWIKGVPYVDVATMGNFKTG